MFIGGEGMQDEKRANSRKGSRARRRMKRRISFVTGLLIGLTLIALCLGALLAYMNYTGYGATPAAVTETQGAA